MMRHKVLVVPFYYIIYGDNLVFIKIIYIFAENSF